MDDDVTTPAWLDELDLVPGPPFLRMGTRALGGEWLLDGPDVGDQLAEKRRILATHHHEVVAMLDDRADLDEAAGELLAAVQATLGLADRASADVHPIDAAGRLVAEDLCLLVPDGASWVLGGGSVCFPSHWRLRDKLGCPIAEVHGPVPHYDAELAGRVDRFLDRLKDGPGVWRRNWTVHASPQLYAPVPPSAPPDRPVTGHDAGERLWLRSERQTLRRLPRSGAIVFGIRTQQVRLGAVAAHGDLCWRLAATARAWSPEFLAYRGGRALRDPLVDWLDRQVPDR